ncbi:MAG: hypothetical protein A2149_00015 [Candidatus Schekmanbacteria bacterium RBG_16_38_11]|uniref:Uncharacterized protein n=1 Tax=Candidatus Schekmanbacteria bacterium RBG_16_38_11 TaxID=1817880 RepID=A0A1F7RTZ2_9BACT|nr:MAG: hypothetical protein A2149_00015 [Candidatus Schekmanbacteria bacterium RBG_16_38_11]
MNEKIKVKFRKINSQGLLVASATVPLIPEKGIWIKDWLIFNNNDKISSSPPSRRYQDNQGNTKYASYLYFEDRDLYWKWCNRIADLYKEWIASGGVEEEPLRYQKDQGGDLGKGFEEDAKADDLEIDGDDEFKVPF